MRTTRLATLLLGLALAVAGPAGADDGDPYTFRFTGRIVVAGQALPTSVALCTTACFQGGGDRVTISSPYVSSSTDGSFAFIDVPVADYAIAFIYPAQDGEDSHVVAGYVRDTGAQWERTQDFTAAQLFSMQGDRDQGTISISGDEPNRPDPYGPPKVSGSARAVRYTLWPISNRRRDIDLIFELKRIPAGATVRLAVWGCRGDRRPLATAEIRRRGSSEAELEVANAQRKFGRKGGWKATISKPGFAPSVATGTWRVPRSWSCRSR